MDAVAEACGAVVDSFERWAGEAPHALAAGNGAFTEWAEQGPTLLGALGAFGSAGTMTGTHAAGTPVVRSSTRATTRRRTRRAGSNGAFKAEKILAELKAGPMNQSQLSEKIGASRQTIARHLEKYVKAGQVTASGAGARKTWAVAP